MCVCDPAVVSAATAARAAVKTKIGKDALVMIELARQRLLTTHYPRWRATQRDRATGKCFFGDVAPSRSSLRRQSPIDKATRVWVLHTAHPKVHTSGGLKVWAVGLTRVGVLGVRHTQAGSSGAALEASG